MALTTVDQFLARVTSGFEQRENFAVDQRVANTALGLFSHPVKWRYVIPSMPSGVSAFIPTELDVAGNSGYLVLSKAIDLGSLDISTNVFTDGVSMPTVTELGVSRQVSGGLLAVVETALNATPGSLSVTYVDQDGNAAQASAAVAMTASSGVESACLVQLSTPDWGVQDVTTAVRTGGTTPTGVVRFYGLIPVGQIAGAANLASPVSLALLGLDFNPVRLAAGDLLLLQCPNGTAARATIGSLQFVGDTP